MVIDFFLGDTSRFKHATNTSAQQQALRLKLHRTSGHYLGHNMPRLTKTCNFDKAILSRPLEISGIMKCQINNSWDTVISWCDHEKSKIKVISEVKGRHHIVHRKYNRYTSFSVHVIRNNHSSDMVNRVSDFEKPHPKAFVKRPTIKKK